MCLQKRTSNSRNVAADNSEKRINGGEKTAGELLVMVFMYRMIQPIERNIGAHQREGYALWDFYHYELAW